MRQFKYTILPPVGNVQTHKHGTVKDLLFDAPYFFFEKDVIPPFEILNEFLRRGICDAGMSGGCRWKKFALSEEEYAELVEDLLTAPDRQLIVPELPENIKTYEKWLAFRVEFIRKSAK
jgi:hypothetical protein